MSLHLNKRKTYGQSILDLEHSVDLRMFCPKQITPEMPIESQVDLLKSICYYFPITTET